VIWPEQLQDSALESIFCAFISVQAPSFQNGRCSLSLCSFNAFSSTPLSLILLLQPIYIPVLLNCIKDARVPTVKHETQNMDLHILILRKNYQPFDHEHHKIIQGDPVASAPRLSAIKPLFMHRWWSVVVGTPLSPRETTFSHIRSWKCSPSAFVATVPRCSEFFIHRVISKCLWLIRIPDLTPPDTFPVGTIDMNTSHTIDDLK
jgi:hypothetical protein